MSTFCVSQQLFNQLIPNGSPLSQVDRRELLPLPIAVLAHARTVTSVTFGPRLLQIGWKGNVVDEFGNAQRVQVAWHVRERRGVVATNNSIRSVDQKALYDLLSRMRR